MTLHRVLRRFLPRRLRDAHGDEMERVFRERLARARRQGGWLGAGRTWFGEGWDLARTGARLRLEGTGRPKTGGGGMRGWAEDLGRAARSLRRSPLYTLFAAGTIALGIGAATTLFSAVDRILLRPVDFPEADRVVAVWRSQGDLLTSASRTSERRIRETEGLFDRVSLTRRSSVGLSTGEGALRLQAVWVDESFATLAGLDRPVLGRAFGREDVRGEGAAVVALGEDLWRSRFGADPAVVGRTVRIDGEPRTVVGVFPAELTPPSPAVLDTDLWMPLGETEEAGGLELFARLAPGVSLEGARERVAALAGEGGAESEWSLRLLQAGSLEGQRLHSPLSAVAVAVALLLLIACGNVASLLLARADQRSGETAVRAALGAARGRLVRESMGEALIVALLGGAAGMALAAGAIEGIRRVRPDALHLLDGLALDPPVLAAALATTLLTALLFGGLPALRRSRRDPAAALGRRGGSADRDSSRLRRALLVGEVALSFALLVGAGQLVASLAELGARETGFDTTELVDLRVGIPEWRYPDGEAREAVLENLEARVAGLPGVRSVARGNGVPPQTGIFFGAPHVEGAEEPEAGGGRIFFGNSVTAGYFETLGQEVVAGRPFTAQERRAGAEVMLMGRSTAARFFPGGDALGGRFRLDGTPWRTVIGIVEDVLPVGHAETSDHGQIYFPARTGEAHTLAVRAARPAELVPRLRAVVADVDPEITVNSVGTVAADYRDALARERLLTSLLAAFAAAAALLTAVGLYGVVSWIAARRTREFGIRISLGAERRRVFRTVLRSGLGTVVLGLVTGGLVTWWGMGLLGAGIVGLSAPSPVAFLGAAVLLGSVALAATVAPAVRAASADPVEALRAD